MAGAVGRGEVTLVFQSAASSFHRDILTHQSNAMGLMRQAIAHNPITFIQNSEQRLAVSNGWGEN